MAGSTPWDELLAAAGTAVERLRADLDDVERRRVDELEAQTKVAKSLGRSQRIEPRERDAAGRAAKATQALADDVRAAAEARRQALAEAAGDIATLLGDPRSG